MTAPMLGEYRASHHRIRFGDLEITAVLDGGGVRDGLHPIFGHDVSKEAFADYAALNHLSAERFEHYFTPAVVNTGSELVLFDTGLGRMGRESGAGKLRERLPEAGYRPEDVDIVVITHSHPDHIAGLWEGEERAFPNARYVIGQREYDGWSKGDAIPPQREQNRELFLKLLPPLADETTFVAPGDTVASGITAVEAFGHSVGHMAYMIESAGRPLLLWADIANHYVFSVQRPEWQVSFDDHKEAAIATRKRILDMAATDQLPVLGFHMPFPGFGFVERAGDGYRWVPETYRLRT